MNQGTKAEHSQTAWHALTIQSLGKESLYSMSFGPPFSRPLCSATSFSTVFLGPDGGTPRHYQTPKACGKTSLKKFFSRLLYKHVNFSKLALNPLFAAKTGGDLGSGQKLQLYLRGYKAFRRLLLSPDTHWYSHTHTHIIGSYPSVLQMEVLWTAACSEMRIARLFLS